LSNFGEAKELIRNNDCGTYWAGAAKAIEHRAYHCVWKGSAPSSPVSKLENSKDPRPSGRGILAFSVNIE